MSIGILPSSGFVPRTIAVRLPVPEAADVSAGSSAVSAKADLGSAKEIPDQRQAASPFNRPANAGRPISIGGASAVDAQVLSQEVTPTKGSDNPLQLSEEDQAVVEELKARDREVRAHEAAHAATGGAYAGSPSYEFERGPDGRQYAVGGQVSIDSSPVSGDPKATIQKMETVKRAALAPAKPSGQDLAVARSAEAAAQAASAELAKQRADEADEGLQVSGDAPAIGFAPQPETITDIFA